MEFSTWFEERTGHAPHDWQQSLGIESLCANRLIRIPTGMGKTLGVLAAWSYHRLVRADTRWPRRLVWCLPMRTLVEQTAAVARQWLARWPSGAPTEEPLTQPVGVHVLMGGAAADLWHLEPEAEAVLIGTQDMLLSRALNRGYGAPRGRWPMEYALLHTDSLWVLDEIQLMDVGLTTSIQLQAAREGERRVRATMPAPAVSWWMSATLQPTWLATKDFDAEAASLGEQILRVSSGDADTPTIATAKPLEIQQIDAQTDPDRSGWAQRVATEHRETSAGRFGRITLAIANTVDDATALFSALQSIFRDDPSPPDLHVIHARFRPLERASWQTFLSRDACHAAADRIIVSTQVIEAGIDLTASALVTQLAPWPSLVQRFGRAGRYGDPTRITVIDRMLSEKTALPYDERELSAALDALARVGDASPASLDAVEATLREEEPTLLAALYPHAPLHELSLREFDELFDTGPDLTGLDIDVSRFIRSGDERDLLVWWWSCEEGVEPDWDLQPANSALCPVPAHRARAWLTRAGRLKDGCRAWVWDYLDGRWRRVNESDLYPGRTVLVDSAWGGYRSDLGFTGAMAKRGDPPIETAGTRAVTHPDLLADLAQNHENLSESPYKTIATHGREVAEEVAVLAKELSIDEVSCAALDLAARLHDYGKAHATFQAAIRGDRRAPHVAHRNDLAKAPDSNWRHGRGLFGKRRGFRHELASTIGLFELLRRADPWHPALLGEIRNFIDAGAIEAALEEGAREGTAPAPAPDSIEAELAALDGESVDLVAYLVCSHHGKVRVSWQSTPDDHDLALNEGTLPIRGVVEGDELPSIFVAGPGGKTPRVPGVKLHLDLASMGLSSRFGTSWYDRTCRLRDRVGDLKLAFLEALLRTADVRASQRETGDPLIEEVTS